MFRHLLVPTDGSNLSTRTVEQAVVFAKGSGARLTFLHVQPGAVGPGNVALYGSGGVINPSWYDSIAQANQAYATHVLEEARLQAEAAGVLSSGETVVGTGIAETIIDTALRSGADLIVMASHGHRGLAGVLLGSETQRVLTHSTIPVLVYRFAEAP